MLTDRAEKTQARFQAESLAQSLMSCAGGCGPEECHYQRQPDGAALALGL